MEIILAILFFLYLAFFAVWVNKFQKKQTTKLRQLSKNNPYSKKTNKTTTSEYKNDRYESQNQKPNNSPPQKSYFTQLLNSTSKEEKKGAFARLLPERIVVLDEPITDDLANRVVAQLLSLEAEDPDKDIYLYINSPGGSVYDGLGIFDTMQHVKPDIQTVCVGHSAGMATFLLCSGTKGKRSSLIQARISLTPLVRGASKQTSDIAIKEDEILFLNSRLYKELAERIGQTIEQIEDDSVKNLSMSPIEAVSYGVIDNVIEGRPT